MSTRRSTWSGMLMLLSVCGAVALPASVYADQTIRTGDGLLQVQANMPEETRVGEQFSYQITVTNTSDDVTLHDVQLQQRKAEGFSIESTSMSGSDQAKKSKQATEEKNQASDGQIKIAMLGPGESRTVDVKAAADKEGQLRSCLEVVNYRPAICMTAQVVKPDLQITKTAPEKADRCEMIELEYAVKNDGSGDVGKFQVVDELGSGLSTIDGNSTLKFDVDGLRAGDTRKFVARVYASKPGEFSSRAVAKAANSDLKARSKQTTTKVVAADLAVQVDGPGRLYGNELATFTARVTNTGNTAAEDVRVRVMYPEKSQLADMGNAQMISSDQSKENKQNAKNKDSKKQGEPTVAKKDAGNKSNNKQDKQASGNKNQQNNQDSMKMREEAFVIETLDPGQTAEFQYAIRPGDLQELPTKVEAKYVCSVDQAQDQAKAESVAISTGMARATVVRLPAMQLVVFDDEDPVSDGSEVTYMVRVWNEGDAKDSNVELKANIPDGLEFVSAQGPTEHSADGSTITFKPIDTMAPGDRADFRITAKSTGTGNVRFEAELNSESLDNAVTSEEPTKLFSRQASAQQ